MGGRGHAGLREGWAREPWPDRQTEGGGGGGTDKELQGSPQPWETHPRQAPPENPSPSHKPGRQQKPLGSHQNTYNQLPFLSQGGSSPNQVLTTTEGLQNMPPQNTQGGRAAPGQRIDRL